MAAQGGSAFYRARRSDIQRIDPVEPGMRADRDLAQRRPRAMPAAGVDGRSALRPDGKSHLVGTVHDDLHRVLALREIGRPRPEFRDIVAGQILSRPVGAPEGPPLPRGELAGRKNITDPHT